MREEKGSSSRAERRARRAPAAAPRSEADEARALAGVRVLRTFDGLEPGPAIVNSIAQRLASGVTIFRARNVGSPAQLRDACARLQAARPAGDPPLIIGLDQEGGQLQAVGHGATAWPGNLALGATASEPLAEAAGAAIGAEAAAMGATLVYAPDADVLGPSSATPLGTRSFGSAPERVAGLVAAFTRGLQSAGVAATLKHFPGHGDATGDSHVAMPTVEADAATIRARDLPPFRAGIAAGALAVLPGHLAAPALTDGIPVAATVSRRMLEGLLRGELGFGGLIVSDAMDMGGAGRLDEAVVGAAEAGIDLLLLVHPPEVEDAVVASLAAAIRSGRIDRARAASARDRIHRVRGRLGLVPQPSLDVVGSAAHQEIARRIAEAAVTLVRDPAGLLPLRPDRLGRVAVLAPVPVDLTPAETSSYVHLGLGAALRERGLRVDELVVPLDPTPAQVAALAHAAAGADVALVGTFDAVSHPGQGTLVEALAGRMPVVGVALRSPYDVACFPPAVTAACTYGIQPPQVEALVDALTGRIPFPGRLPVVLPGDPASPVSTREVHG